MLATAAAAAALLLGTGPGADAIRVLHPGSLEPVAASPAFPASTSQVERSPDGRRLVAAHDGGLAVFGASGRRVARIRVATANRVLSWLTRDRIAVVKRGKPTTVRIVSVRARDVVHREVVRARLVDTARSGTCQVTLTTVITGDEPVLNVFGADGTLERTIELPGIVDGVLHGRAPDGQALVLDRERPLAYSVDVATGTATRHDLDLADAVPAGWVEPARGDMLAIEVFTAAADEVVLLDPATFAVLRRVPVAAYVEGAGDGFVSFDDEGSAPLQVFGPDGVERWRKPGLSPLDAAGFGDRLYAGTGYDDVRVREFDLATGRLLRALPGRAALFEPSAGRVRVPFFGNPAIAED